MKHFILALLFAAMGAQAGVSTVVSPTQTVDPVCVASNTAAASAAGVTITRDCPVVQSVTTTYTAPAPPSPVPPASAPVPPPPAPPASAPSPATQDFATRCATAIRCFGFESASEISGSDNDNFGLNRDGTTNPTLDCTVFASGKCALKLTVPSVSDANSSGAFFANFSPDLSVQFGSNSDFYIQWRQRFSATMLQKFPVTSGQGGFKQVIIGSGDQTNGKHWYSCTSLEVVPGNRNQFGFPGMYNSCTGSSTHQAFDEFNEKFKSPANSDDFKLENGRASPFCLYSQNNGDTYFPPKGNCFQYKPDQWMTFQVHIHVGPRSGDEFKNSTVEFWGAYEGQPSELIIKWGPYNLSAGAASLDQKYGKVWLLNYNTGKDGSKSNPVAYTWYDDLIISRQKIADPL